MWGITWRDLSFGLFLATLSVGGIVAVEGWGDPWWRNLLLLLGFALIAALILSRGRRWQ